MPGYIGNYKLDEDSSERYSTLACKLVTSFPANAHRPQPLPTIFGTIFLMDPQTGRLKAIIEATKITAWRTAGASIVATKHLYMNRQLQQQPPITLAIVGCGVQGTVHAIGMCNTFEIATIYLWNRTPSKALALAAELDEKRSQFRNQSMRIVVSQSVADGVREADVIVTATNTDKPIIQRKDLKQAGAVHINCNNMMEFELKKVEDFETTKVYL